MRRASFFIAALPTLLSILLGSLLSTDVAYGFVGPGRSPGSLLATIARPDREGNRLARRMASVVAAKELQSYRPIGELFRTRSLGLPTPVSTTSLPRAASAIVRNNRNRFAVGTVSRISNTPVLPYRKVLDDAGVARRTLGGVHESLIEYSISLRTKPIVGSHGAGIDRAWKLERQLVEKTGKGSRSWTPKQTQELLEKGKVDGFKGHHINSFGQHPEWAGDPRNIKFLTQEDHLKAHGGAWQNQTTGKLIDREKTMARHSGTTVSRLRNRIAQSKFAKTIRMASNSRFVRPVLKTMKSALRIGGRVLEVAAEFSVVGDFAFAGHGYYDTVTRYQAGQLDHDLMVVKMGVHTSEAGIGAVGVYLLLAPEPSGATKVAGIVVIVASVALVAVDFALDAVDAGRTEARERLLKKIVPDKRFECVLRKLAYEAGNVGMSTRTN